MGVKCVLVLGIKHVIYELIRMFGIFDTPCYMSYSGLEVRNLAIFLWFIGDDG